MWRVLNLRIPAVNNWFFFCLCSASAFGLDCLYCRAWDCAGQFGWLCVWGTNETEEKTQGDLIGIGDTASTSASHCPGLTTEISKPFPKIGNINSESKLIFSDYFYQKSTCSLLINSYLHLIVLLEFSTWNYFNNERNQSIKHTVL